MEVNVDVALPPNPIKKKEVKVELKKTGFYHTLKHIKLS